MSKKEVLQSIEDELVFLYFRLRFDKTRFDATPAMHLAKLLELLKQFEVTMKDEENVFLRRELDSLLSFATTTHEESLDYVDDLTAHSRFGSS